MAGSSRKYVDSKTRNVKENPPYYTIEDKISSLGGRKFDDDSCPNNFYVGRAIANGSCFFDSFRQGLEEEKGVKVTVEQLRNDCKEFAKNNPPQWFVNGISENYYSSDFVNKETPSEYVKNIGNNNRWGNPEIEGRILCEKYDVDLHVVERIEYTKEALKQWKDMKRKGEVSEDLQRYGHSAIGTRYDRVAINNYQRVGGEISADKAYSVKNVIRVINTGAKHFEPLLDVNKSFERKFNGQNKEDYKAVSQSNKKGKNTVLSSLKRVVDKIELIKEQKDKLYRKRKGNEGSDIAAKRSRQEGDFKLAKRLQQEEDDFVLARRLQEKEDFKFAKHFQQEEGDFVLARRLQEKEDFKFAKHLQREEDHVLSKSLQKKESVKPSKKCKEQDQSDNIWKNKLRVENNSKSPTIRGF